MATVTLHPGLTYCAGRGQWMAQITRVGRKVFLGRFKRKRDARDAYREAKRERDEQDPPPPKHKPAPKPVRKSKRPNGSQEPRYDSLLISQALHGYVILQLEAEHGLDRWGPHAITWMEEALALDNVDLNHLLRAAIDCIRVEANAPSTDYQCELELATEAALDALFAAAKCEPLFAREIDDE